MVLKDNRKDGGTLPIGMAGLRKEAEKGERMRSVRLDDPELDKLTIAELQNRVAGSAGVARLKAEHALKKKLALTKEKSNRSSGIRSSERSNRSLERQTGGDDVMVEYKGGSYMLHTGNRGGKYIIIGRGDQKKKLYITKSTL